VAALELLARRAEAQPSPPPAEVPATARAPAPNPAEGESYDGAEPEHRSRAAYVVPQILFFPFRLLTWATEPLARPLIEFEERHHVYGRLYEAFTSDDGKIGVRPTFRWVSSFRPTVGAHFFDNRLLGPGTMFNLDLAGWVDVVETSLHLRPTHIGRRVQAFIDFSFNRRNDWLFTGLGSTAPAKPGQLKAARYLANNLDLGGRLDLHSWPFLTFSFGAFFGWRRFANGESYDGDAPIEQVYCLRNPTTGACIPNTVDNVLVPGFDNGTQFIRPYAAIHLDLRDDPVRPTLGVLIDAEADYSHGLGADDSSYFRVRGAATIDLTLWPSHSHVLVLRGATELVAPTGDQVVPFSELATLGGPDTMRGFRVNNFRDFSSLIFTAEYRWPIILWVDASLFFDYGGVFGRWYANFGASQMQPDVGFGFRLRSRDRFYIKMQFAYGFDNGWEIYLTGQNLP
jgi:hypothetical protein